MLAAARAVSSGKIEIPSSLPTNISTCLRIQQEAARAYGDRDTPAKPDPRGAAHSRLQALFARVLGTLSGGADPGGDDHGRVTEEQVLGGGGSSEACWRSLCFMLDLDESFLIIAETWKKCKAGATGLVHATLMTNSSVAFLAQLARELEAFSPHLNTLETIVAQVYMEPAVNSILVPHKLEQAEAVKLVSAIHEGFQRNLEIFQQVRKGRADVKAAH